MNIEKAAPLAALTSRTGRIIDLLNFKPEDVYIEDIAHALACTNRFNGHTKEPISVAQHSVMVAMFCEGTGYELQALLHDGSEAYIGDVTKWLKQSVLFDGYRQVEDRIQRIIWKRFECDIEQDVAVSNADKFMVSVEAYLFHHGISAPGYATPTAAELEMVQRCASRAIGKWAPASNENPMSAWGWREARNAFLDLFDRHNH